MAGRAIPERRSAMTMDTTGGTPDAGISDLMAFLDASPTAWHATRWISGRLDAEGRARLDEAGAGEIRPGGKYHVVRNGSAVAAFVAGTASPAEAGFRMIGAHTDSPALKIKPNAVSEASGYLTLGVEVYGGPVLATWVDRDLRLAGRVALRSKDAPRGHVTVLVSPVRPLVLVPGLAIHLDRKVNDEGLKPNAQDHMPAVLSLASGGKVPEPDPVASIIAAELGVEPGDVLAHDLFLVDAQPAALAGAAGDLLRSGRLDDLAMCHAAATALARSSGAAAPATRIVILTDNEEVGSATPQGAASPMLGDLMERITIALGQGREALMRAARRSIMVSADMAHAVHPSYQGKHDPKHRPALNGGPVLKVNASMRYATDAEGWAIFEAACAAAGVPVQRFVTRSDMQSGSTIGPIAASRTGVLTVDVGNPILGMHSIRETGGVMDHDMMTRALERFLVMG